MVCNLLCSPYASGASLKMIDGVYATCACIYKDCVQPKWYCSFAANTPVEVLNVDEVSPILLQPASDMNSAQFTVGMANLCGSFAVNTITETNNSGCACVQ